MEFGTYEKEIVNAALPGRVFSFIAQCEQHI
jgi:hypothetical protein